MREPWLTLAEAAFELNVSYRTLWRDARAGRIPGIKIRGVWRVRLSELEAHYRAEPPPPPGAAGLAAAAALRPALRPRPVTGKFARMAATSEGEHAA